MRPVLIALALVLALVQSASSQIIDEMTIDRGSYKVVGAGIAYNDGTWKESDPTIDYSNPTKWSNVTTPTPWEVNTSNLTVSIGRHGHTKSTITPDGVYWLNTTTWAVTKAADWAVPVVTENPTSVFLDGILADGDGDAELVSKVSGISWDYVFNDDTGWAANPYPVAESALVVRYQLGKNHTMTADGAPVDWGGTAADTITFETNGETFDLGSVVAEDANGFNPAIRYYLRTAQGKDWFMEGVSAEDFAAATLPMRYHYTVIVSNITSNTTWSGEYFIATEVSVLSATLTIDAGTIIKGGNVISSGIETATSGIFDVNGTEDNHVMFTSCLDDSHGTDMTSEANCSGTYGSPAAGDWGGIDLSCPDAGCSYTVDYAEFAYGGNGAGSLDWILSLGSSTDASYVANAYIHDSCATTGINYPIVNFPYKASYYYVIKDSIIDQEGECYVMWEEPAAALVHYRISNNLIRSAITSNSVVHLRGGLAAGQSMYFTNNTVVCTAATTAIGADLLIWRASADGRATDNLVTGCGTGYEGLLGPIEVQSHNKAWNNTTDFGGSWATTGTEDSDDPSLSTSHDHSTKWPFSVDATLDNYHFATTSDMVDTGSRLASAAGLDALHITDDGTADSGTVDRGYHYTAFGGGTPPGPGPGGSGSGQFLRDPINFLWLERR